MRGGSGLLGHSEGAVAASIAAARSKEIAFVVLLAGPAIPGEQLQLLQTERIGRAMGVPEAIARKDREVQQKLFAMSRAGAGSRTVASCTGRRDRRAAAGRRRPCCAGSWERSWT